MKGLHNQMGLHNIPNIWTKLIKKNNIDESMRQIIFSSKTLSLLYAHHSRNLAVMFYDGWKMHKLVTREDFGSQVGYPKYRLGFIHPGIRFLNSIAAPHF